MKVGLITSHYVNNYGTFLQVYATNQVFRLLGWDCEVIDYRRKGWFDEGAMVAGSLECSKKLSKNLAGRLLFWMLIAPSIRRRCRLFESALRRYVTLSEQRFRTLEELCANPPVADVYCTGSDQVWNQELNGGMLYPNYLAFAPEGKRRISFAASFGKDHLEEDEKKTTQELLQRYTAISVRESSGLSILEGLGIGTGFLALDPTLMLTQKAWRDFSSQSKRVYPERYILVYQVNFDDCLLDDMAKALARRTNCRLIRIDTNRSHLTKPGKMVLLPDMPEFVGWIAHADFVLTDSFHMTSFSINMNRPFFASYPQRYSTRIESVLQMTGLLCRRVSTVQDIETLPLNVDFASANEALAEARENTFSFLRQALEV